MNALKVAAFCCMALCASTTMAADYVAIKVEAENHFSKDGRWQLTSASVNPGITPDPDGSHHASASGQAYLELLSDTRVTHGDPLINGVNFWSQGGSGPAIDYIVNIPEAGRYTVWVKAYSTGTEDNGIHVGLNSSNPGSGERIQWCNGKNQWTWSSAQRTNSNHCGTTRTIYLDIGNAGANTIRFTAREDGFEMDQFMLIKENVSGLQCQPQGNDQVSCNRPATPSQPANPPSQPAPPVQPPVPSVPQDDPTAGDLRQCTTSASDPDGDGYGFENEQSCLVTSNTTSAPPTTDTYEIASCASAASDPDGDGYGWENDRSCLVTNSAVSNTGQYFCASSESDADGDGWGWEMNRSCVVR